MKRRLHIERTLFLLGVVLFWLLVFFATKAHAQSSGWYQWSERSSPQPHGEVVYLWNATSSQILAGTVVMSDSSSTTPVPQVPLGKGFRTWDGSTSNVKRIVGVLLNDTQGNQPTQVLVFGWTNYVKMDASGIAGGTYLRPSLTVAGALTSYANADSANSFKPVVGQFARYESTTSLYGYAKVDFRSVASGSK